MIPEILGISCIGVLWICSEPTVRLRNWCLGNHDGIFRRMLECAMCSTFWISVIYNLIWLNSFDLFFISITSILAELICRKLNWGNL